MKFGLIIVITNSKLPLFMKLIYKLSLLLMLCFLFQGNFAELRAQNNEKPIITNQDKTITLYPIPANTSIHIRLSPALRNEVDKVEIVNLIGRKLTEQMILDRSSTEISFNNLSELPQGIYMVVARDRYGKIIQSAKLIINR